MRVATICICLVVMIALVCAQQQQNGKSGKHGGAGHKHHQHKNSKVEAAVSHGKQGVKSAKNAKSKQSNIKAEWKTETLVVEVLPSQKSSKKAQTKAEVPVVEKNTFGKKNVRSAVVDERRRTPFAQKKQRSVEVAHADEKENIVEEEEQVIVVPKQKKVAAKSVKLAKKKTVDETKKDKPCPCSAAKMQVDNEDVDESIDEVVESPCAATKAKVAKKAKTSACRKVVEEESSIETPCSKKAKNSCAGDATLSCKKIAKATTKKVAVSTKPIKQCPLDAMVQCAKGWERDATTGECKPSTGCSIKKEKALKKIGIRLPAKHSVTVKQNDENNTDDLVVDIMTNDETNSDEQHELIVTDSDDVEIIDEDEESSEIVCEMCTRD